MIARPIPPAASGGTYIPPEDTFEIHTATPAVRFITQAAQPPSNLYISMGEALQINAASSQANEAITVTYRLLLANGSLHSGQFVMQVTSNRAVNTHSEQLAEGYLLSVSCQAASATTRGQTFARLFITKTAIGAGVPSYVLMSDYVTNQITAGFPNGRVLAPSEGPGNIRGIASSVLVANQEWVFACPTNARWRPISIDGQLQTDATAGTRSSFLDVTVSGLGMWSLAMVTAQGPSTTTNVNITSGVTNFADTVAGKTYKALPMPTGLFVLAGGQLNSATTFVGPSDIWLGVNMQVEEWLDNV